MKVCWRALFGYGFVFWVLLCITDLMGITNIHKYSKDFDELYERPTLVKDIKQEPDINKFEFRGVKFEWSLLIWNFLTFLGSVIAFSLIQRIGWKFWKSFNNYRHRCISLNQNSTRTVTALSRIPVVVKQPVIRASDTILSKLQVQARINIEKSCPNLLMKRSKSNLSSITDITGRNYNALFRHDLYSYKHRDLSPEQQLQYQCEKLKEELHHLQMSSLKEHAALSRKLETIIKDKKEISKQMIVMQKENRAAKQELEELVQEKTSLLKKLENATKEFKTNTKTKKIALAKLEEVTSNIEELRQQLEQVTRDKEILEKKLRLLETEYTKLHERYIAAQQAEMTRNDSSNLPERDDTPSKLQLSVIETLNFGSTINDISTSKAENVLASVSRTEFDMKLIQEKIRQLERNLENLNLGNEQMECYKIPDQLESDISFYGLDGNSDSQNRLGTGSRTTLSGYSSNNSPRSRFWSDKVTQIIGRNRSQFAKIQALANEMQEKAKFLGGIKRRTDESTAEEDTSQSEDREPKRLVSSSVAFKNFLKSLNGLEATNKQLPQRSGGYF